MPGKEAVLAKYSFAQLQADYADRWAAMVLTPARLAVITEAARKIMAGRVRYEAVEAATGVPWAFIGVLHYRESACDFRGVLHNGERILGTGRKTALVPKGRGPFSTWEEAARDALGIKGFRQGVPGWSLLRCLFEGERFNGFGYRMRGVPSAYLWSGSNQYQGGKYVADGTWSATAVDRQIGIAPLMKHLMAMDAAVSFDNPVRAGGGVLSVAEIRSVQQRLRDLGYAEVGRVDGVWGPRTMAGVVAFQATTSLPVTGRLDAATAAGLATAGRRPVSAERAEISAKKLRQEGDAVARATAATRYAAVGLGVPAMLLGIVDQFQAASSRLSGLSHLMGEMPGWIMTLAVVGVAIALYVMALRTEAAQLMAVREGRDAGPA